MLDLEGASHRKENARSDDDNDGDGNGRNNDNNKNRSDAFPLVFYHGRRPI